jgi:hypothetical protein
MNLQMGTLYYGDNLEILRVNLQSRSCQMCVAVTPRHRRVAATPSSRSSNTGENAGSSGDEGVASTFLRRGVAATHRRLRNSF